ncbi:MAG: hypothetical protein M0P71_11465 [Melioribacteraceae bacterium]|nr:hypothetical protein [Melioribacteraceae bacterium]
MTLKLIKYIPFSLLFNHKFSSSICSYSEREIYLMKFIDENGIVFISEAAPLPSFSDETTVEVINSLSQLMNNIIKLEPMLFDLPPSIRYGIEQAFLYKSISIGKPLVDFNLPKKVHVNSLFSLNEKIEGKLGATTKIKIGNDFTNELELIKKIPQETKIRLDVNGAWDLETAKKNLDILSSIENIQYIEDPCRTLNENIKLGGEKLIKIAIDNDCRNNADIKKLEVINEIDFLILKPALSGSLFELADILTKSKKNIIITSAFESCISRHSLILLATLLKHDYAHGLSTGKYFSNDICEELYPILNGEIKIDSLEYPKDLLIEV